jgi:oligopeptide transport system ATP-binding protein
MENLLEVKDLTVEFRLLAGTLRAVDEVSFSVKKGETFGVVGESGSGKSVTSLSLIKLLPFPLAKIVKGSVLFKGEDILKMSDEEVRRLRGNRISMIFQDPMTSLNPVLTIGYQLTEAIRVHSKMTKKEAKERAVELLSQVGISNPRARLSDYPHQFSGGMRQRVMIAMALSCKPDFLIADEPTTALDVTVEAQILDLLMKLKEEYHSTVMLITHNLGIVAKTATSILVMYAGRTYEYGPVDDVFYHPLHPYTRGLLNSLTRIDERRKGRLKPIPGTPPSMVKLPSGCRFHPRCDFAQEICRLEEPLFEEVSPGRFSRCHFSRKLDFKPRSI